MARDDDDRRAIYEQDMECVRYRHSVKWGRFQTVSAIEGAALYVSFKGGLSTAESVLTMVLATLLIGLAFVLVNGDEKAISAYGNASSNSKFPPTSPLFLAFSAPSLGSSQATS